MVDKYGDSMMNPDVPLEKLLEKVDNKYKVVMIAALRARQLNDGARPLVKMEGKYSALALRELLDEKLLIKDLQKKKKGAKSEPKLSGINFAEGSNEKDENDEDTE